MKRRNRNKFKQDTDPSMAQTAAAQRPSSAAAAQALVSGALSHVVPKSNPGARGPAQQAAAADALAHKGAQPGQQRQRSSSATAAAPAQQEELQRQAAEPAAAEQPKRKKRKRQQEQRQQDDRQQPTADAVPKAKPSAAIQPSVASGSKPQTAAAAAAAAAAPLKAAGGSKLLDKMRGKLQGGRFRWLNEQLYTSTGDAALRMMQVRARRLSGSKAVVTM